MIIKYKNGFSIAPLIFILAIITSAALGIYIFRLKILEYRLLEEQKQLPKAISAQEANRNNGAILGRASLSSSNHRQEAVELKPQTALVEASTTPEVVKDEINLAVPFTVQAPFGIWDAIHEDGCEEASALMLARYYKNESIKDPHDADTEILKLVDWENRTFGFNKDTSAALTARILKEYYGFKNVMTRYDTDVSVDSIKKELTAGRPVIVPSYGRALHNPFFRQGGPTYHMIVLKGYTKDGKFIVNDPGTKRGADFIYGEDVIMKAINDWDNEKGGLSGKKAMIIVR